MKSLSWTRVAPSGSSAVPTVSGPFRRVMQQKRPGIHWGQIVSVVLMLMLSALAVGIVLGYVYTATEFIQALMASFVFLGAVEVVVNLLRRWLLLGERRLALNRLREAARLAQTPSERSIAGSTGSQA